MMRGALWLASIQTLAIAGGHALIALFVMIVVDSALPAHASETVIGLALFALLLVAGGGAVRLAQGRLLADAGATLLAALISAPGRLEASAPGTSTRGGSTVVTATFNATTSAVTTRDIAIVEGALGSSTVTALFGLLIVPPMLLLMLALHPWLAVTLAAGVAILFLLIAQRWMTRPRTTAAAPATDLTLIITDHGELLDALGLQSRLQRGWAQAVAASAQSACDSARHARRASSLAVLCCIATVVTVLTVGAGLVIADDASFGTMLAGGYIAAVTGCALYRGWSAAPDGARLRGAWLRLTRLHTGTGPPLPMALPVPVEKVAIADLSLHYAEGGPAALTDVSFVAAAGEIVAVMGLGGSGKSSLLRALTGSWPISGGSIRIDGASLDQWTPAMRAAHIGYRPQEPGLFAGSVAQNIARFDPAISAATIVAAATEAGCHAAIQRLPGGYDHDVGRGGQRLSQSLRQQIALARSVVNRPFLLLLDEPHAHLDHPAEQALHAAIGAARDRGAIIILASNDQRAVDLADYIVILRDGRVVDAGPKADVWARLRGTSAPTPLTNGADPTRLAAPVTARSGAPRPGSSEPISSQPISSQPISPSQGKAA